MQSGDLVRATVWKDVWVDGEVVIAAGTPVFAKVDRMKKAKMAGQKGILEIEVLNVEAVDRSEIALAGGYDRSGKSRMGLTIGLAVGLAWPFVFLKGKNVFLEPGMLFDAMVRASTEVDATKAPLRTTPTILPSFQVSVDYDKIDPDKKLEQVPLLIQLAEEELTRIDIVSVNEQEIPPIQVTLVGESAGEENRYEASVEFKLLSRHFDHGMNRFEVEMGDERAEVLLEIEM